jgi:hypothetical protein
MYKSLYDFITKSHVCFAKLLGLNCGLEFCGLELLILVMFSKNLSQNWLSF